MGLGQALLVLLGVLALVVRLLRREKIEPLQGLGLVVLIVYTWLITPTSRWVWDHIPLLPMAQFPWRLLSVQALAVSLLDTHIPIALPSRGRGAAVAVGVVLAAATGLAGLRVDRLPLREADISPARLMFYETYSGNIGTTVRYEYLPREMVPRPYMSAVQWAGGAKPSPRVLEGDMALRCHAAKWRGMGNLADYHPLRELAGLSHHLHARMARDSRWPRPLDRALARPGPPGAPA